MTTIFVSDSEDFRPQNLTDITAVTFFELDLPLISASFNYTQFATIGAAPNLLITGTAGVNEVQIFGTYIDGSRFSFANWSSADRFLLTGTTGHDQIRGSEGSDSIAGGDGADTLGGGLAGTDTVNGGAGDDLLLVYRGLMDGGAGRDMAQVFGWTSAVGLVVDIVAGGGGVDVGNGIHLIRVEGVTGEMSAWDDVVRGGVLAEWIAGDGGNDLLDMRAGNDTLLGREGNDTLLGGQGADSLDGGMDQDSLRGGAGNDRLFGSLGDDTLGGDEGADLLVGGAGADRMTGGLGADRFIFLSGTDATTADVITDFQQGLDLIDLSRTAASAVHFIGQTDFFDGNEVNWSQTATDTVIELHLSVGAGYAVSLIKLSGLFTLTAADFVL